MSKPTQQAAPHPVLPAYYPEPARRAAFVQQLFDDTAAHYDRINSIFSLGTGAWYRRQALRRAGLRPGMTVLDIATGTGLVAREAARLAGAGGRVWGLDPSSGMLAEARRALRNAAAPVALLQGRAEAIPLPDASVDFISMGYALRHVAELGATFAEFRRVLRPDGRLLLLEIGRPDGRLAHAMARGYLGHVVPALCRLSAPRARSGTLMRYYWDTIEACVPAETILSHLHGAGFAEVGCETSMAMFRAYSARNAPEPGA
ncbi:class I SAM-dependent methyltransferase [Teichococcus vastitatis]|uniref:Class I SAM-dependent methyltransferase n=1 Tax=Teichococcus vastitatis TaxID=2307076 RepID=A0ABS9W609_9PROT|nr:class I SAM-dependent methyltransferase [Pseudoroseomonas vastitatis]MCI0754014.1 class I SAM-dependent methyltransferase [Pseudoroseomonas vastitatis]